MHYNQPLLHHHGQPSLGVVFVICRHPMPCICLFHHNYGSLLVPCGTLGPSKFSCGHLRFLTLDKNESDKNGNNFFIANVHGHQKIKIWKKHDYFWMTSSLPVTPQRWTVPWCCFVICRHPMTCMCLFHHNFGSLAVPCGPLRTLAVHCGPLRWLVGPVFLLFLSLTSRFWDYDDTDHIILHDSVVGWRAEGPSGFSPPPPPPRLRGGS